MQPKTPGPALDSPVVAFDNLVVAQSVLSFDRVTDYPVARASLAGIVPEAN